MIAIAAGCASSPPPGPISAEDRHRFQATVEAARQVATSWDCPRGNAQLRAAESDFHYAENLPTNPERAEQMAAHAQLQADAALQYCRGEIDYRRGPAVRASSVADVR